MTTPQHTRIALLEIPEQLDHLRVGRHGAGNGRTDEDMARLFHMNGPELVNTNILYDPLSVLSSPDEYVIRQRGRRRFTLSWSPEKTPNRIPFQKTPTKPVTTTMTLRSSPRKRLLMNDSSCMPTSLDQLNNHNNNNSITNNNIIINNNNNALNSPKKVVSPICQNAKSEWFGTPFTKKLKLDEKPIAQMNSDVQLSVLLKGLSQDQLVGIIANIVKRDAEVEQRLRTEIPMSDIAPMEEELMHMKRNIFKSLPTSRLCKKTDSLAYARASTHLNAFKKAITTQSRILYDSTHWDALLDYVSMAWNYVRATPTWENNSHNIIRKQCFKILSTHCVAALKYGGLRLGSQRLQNTERNLKEWSKDFEDVLACVSMLNKTLLKYRTSL